MESNNLLSFVNSASSNIQEALGKAPKKRRNVTVKKYAENRVKRLDSSKKPRVNSLTKRHSSSQLKIITRLPPHSSTSLLEHANTWPTISTGLLQPACQPTTTKPSFYTSGSESNLSTQQQTSSRIDPELESILSDLECPSVPMSRHGSFESVCTAPSCTPPLPTLETQMYMCDQALSPYSDFSDELDSAYCSPEGSSTQVSYMCSPAPHLVGNALPDWCATDLLPPPVPTTCVQEAGIISSGCNWVSQDTSPPLTITSSTISSSAASPFDQGPPMTPTVSELLQQYHSY